MTSNGPTSNPAAPLPAVPFGYKTAWFAVRSGDSANVAKSLDLDNLRPANWPYGLWHSIEPEHYLVFVTPPVNDWVIAVGTPILYEADGHAIDRIIELSRTFGEAQFFASMRVSSAYAWARAKDGRLLRMFYDADGERRETGAQTDEEKNSDLHFFDSSSSEANDPTYWERKDLVYVNEDHVLALAERWSVNPAKLGEMDLPLALGVLGEPSSSYPPKPAAVRRRRGFIDRLSNR